MRAMQSSHRLRPAMALVRALLAPTASGDGAGERLCVPYLISKSKFFFHFCFFGTSTLGQEVTVESGGKF